MDILLFQELSDKSCPMRTSVIILEDELLAMTLSKQDNLRNQHVVTVLLANYTAHI